MADLTMRERVRAALIAAAPGTEVDAVMALIEAPQPPKPLAHGVFWQRTRQTPRSPEYVVLHVEQGQENLHIDGEYAIYRRTDGPEGASAPIGPFRTGRKLGRTVYNDDDILIGVMDTPELGAMVVDALNRSAPQLTYGEQIEALKAAGVLVFHTTVDGDGRPLGFPHPMPPGGVDLYRITEDPQLLAAGLRPVPDDELDAMVADSRRSLELLRTGGYDTTGDIVENLLGAITDLRGRLAAQSHLRQLRSAEAPQPRVLRECETTFLGSRNDPQPDRSWFVGGFALDIPPGTRVALVVIEDTERCEVLPNGSVVHRFACDFGADCPSPAGPRLAGPIDNARRQPEVIKDSAAPAPEGAQPDA